MPNITFAEWAIAKLRLALGVGGSAMLAEIIDQLGDSPAAGFFNKLWELGWVNVLEHGAYAAGVVALLPAASYLFQRLQKREPLHAGWVLDPPDEQ